MKDSSRGCFTSQYLILEGGTNYCGKDKREHIEIMQLKAFFPFRKTNKGGKKFSRAFYEIKCKL